MARDPRTIITLPVSFQTEEGIVIAVFHVDKSNSIGIRFETPAQLLGFCSELLEHGSKVWPDNRWMQEYLAED